MVDEIDHLRIVLDERTRRLNDTVRDLRTLLDERYATQTKALDAAFVAAEKAVSTALDSAEKAVAKAELSAERRFESVNEFRAQLADQAGHFVTRVEFDAKVDALSDRMAEMGRVQERAAGKDTGTTAARASVITGAGLLVAIIVAVVTILALNS